MAAKIKVLFIVNDFFQAGAQRYAYETHLSINQDLFDVEFLCVTDLNSSKDWEDYYYPLHKKLGSKITFLNSFAPYSFFRYKFLSKVISRIPNLNLRSNKLLKYFEKFDSIIWFGEYILTSLIQNTNSNIILKSITILMSFKFQGFHSYAKYPKDYKYFFASSFDDEEQVNHELMDFDNYEHIYFPLALNFATSKNQFHFHNNEIKKIGIFTRFATDKPLDIFLFAFHLLSLKMKNIELHLFGNGNPEILGLPGLISRLGLETKVFFRGHQADIVEKAKEEMLDLVWFQGYKNRPAGYAGLDICTTGIPQVLWDFSSSKEKSEGEMIYPLHKNLIEFVADSLKVLTDKLYSQKLSQLQFDEVLKNRNMENIIGNLESAIISISNSKLSIKN